MKKLNTRDLVARANRENIDPHVLAKRAIGYRKSGVPQSCQTCENLRMFGGVVGSQRKQCYIIGESFSIHSDVRSDYICNNYKSI